MKAFNCTCANPYCRKEFYRKKSSIKKSKSGYLFCSRACTISCTGINKLITHPNYGTMKSRHRATYRDRMIQKFNHACAKCGYNNMPDILEVHHIDGDRSNSSEGNLIVLCPNCHREDHYHERQSRRTMESFG